jgi:hypothetical protein
MRRVLNDGDLRAVLDDKCRRGERALTRVFDANCVLERLAAPKDAEKADLLDELAAWAESVNGKLEWQQRRGHTRRDRGGASDLVLLVPRAWFAR